MSLCFSFSVLFILLLLFSPKIELEFKINYLFYRKLTAFQWFSAIIIRESVLRKIFSRKPSDWRIPGSTPQTQRFCTLVSFANDECRHLWELPFLGWNDCSVLIRIACDANAWGTHSPGLRERNQGGIAHFHHRLHCLTLPAGLGKERAEPGGKYTQTTENSRCLPA